MNRKRTDLDRVRSLREMLTATGAGIYLTTHQAGPIPTETMIAIHESDDLELRIGRVGPDREEDLRQREKEARAVAAAVLKAAPERLLLSHGLPEAAVLAALEVLGQRAPTPPGGTAAGRIVVLDQVDPAVRTALREVTTAIGTQLDELEGIPDQVAADVALVVAPHVTDEGDVLDVTALGNVVREAGARLMVDASLSLGALAIDTATLGADVVIAGMHRWLLGPESVALAWLSPDLGAGVPERLRGAVGAFDRASLLATARSVGWLLMYVEMPWLLARTERLAAQLHDSLAAIDGVEMPARSGAHAAVAAFRIRNWDAVTAADELSRSVFAMLEVDAERDLLRASVGAWNREDELDRFMARVAELAEHTPETLPRKPTLTILSGPDEPDGA